MNNAINYHIAFCVNDEYADYIRVSIQSIKEVHKSLPYNLKIHILSDYISNNKLNNLKAIVTDSDNFEIIFHFIDNLLIPRLKTGSWPIHAWFRVLLPEILSSDIKKVLYLDADTLVTSNLCELFSLDMTDKAIAASIDFQNEFSYSFIRCGYEKYKQYICSGVLLMNLEYWRNNFLKDKIIDWSLHNSERIKCPDQDAINYICKDCKIVLPMKYGIMDCFLTNPIFEEAGYINQIQECCTNPVIIHFNGCPPWYKEYRKHTFHDVWGKYNRMLKHPVKRHYQAKGILKAKLIIIRLLTFFFTNAKDRN